MLRVALNREKDTHLRSPMKKVFLKTFIGFTSLNLRYKFNTVRRIFIHLYNFCFIWQAPTQILEDFMWPFLASYFFFLYFCLLNKVDSEEIYKISPIAALEPWTSGVGSDRSTNLATIMPKKTTLLVACVVNRIKCLITWSRESRSLFISVGAAVTRLKNSFVKSTFVVFFPFHGHVYLPKRRPIPPVYLHWMDNCLLSLLWHVSIQSHLANHLV